MKYDMIRFFNLYKMQEQRSLAQEAFDIFICRENGAPPRDTVGELKDDVCNRWTLFRDALLKLIADSGSITDVDKVQSLEKSICNCVKNLEKNFSDEKRSPLQ